MRFFTALFAVAATAITFAAAVPSSERLVKRGGPEVCTSNLDGTGETDEQVTKDCCAAVNQKAYFNEVEKVCEGYGGPADNAVDTGEMVKCCASRQRGSHAV